jgi:heat shock protein HtpX
MGNLLRTAMLMAGLTALFMALGYWIGGIGGMIIALIFAAGGNLFAWWGSDRMVLSIYGAEEVDRYSAPDLVAMVERLARRAELPVPRVFIIPNDQPNAFATGRNPAHAAVAVTTGILRSLRQAELEGVLAHELTHIRNRDTLTMTVTATLAGAIGVLANIGFFFGGARQDERDNPLGGIGGLLLLILAPLAAMLVQLAISRTREYAADAGAARITGQPLALASALARIADEARHVPNIAAEQHPATAPLFIVNPLTGGHLGSLFATHPRTDERIARLRRIGANGPVPASP